MTGPLLLKQRQGIQFFHSFLPYRLFFLFSPSTSSEIITLRPMPSGKCSSNPLKPVKTTIGHGRREAMNKAEPVEISLHQTKLDQISGCRKLSNLVNRSSSPNTEEIIAVKAATDSGDKIPPHGSLKSTTQVVTVEKQANKETQSKKPVNLSRTRRYPLISRNKTTRTLRKPSKTQ